MENQQLIEMLNLDLAEEHAAIIRYIVHGYLEGEDTPLGASLVSRAREEMWHMHWLGMIIGKMGGEPIMNPAVYPFDPTSRKTIYQSYVDYEEHLVPHYYGEAEKMDDPHIRRVLEREAWESKMHANKFRKVLGKLTPEQADSLPGEENELPLEFVEKIQLIVESKYTEMIQLVRNGWVLQQEGMFGWQMMDFSMTNMKQLAHVAEETAENGIEPRFTNLGVVNSATLGAALQKALEDVKASSDRHRWLGEDPETAKHAGLVANIDLTLKQEKYEADDIEDWIKTL
jgi:bacterioferritin